VDARLAEVDTIEVDQSTAGQGVREPEGSALAPMAAWNFSDQEWEAYVAGVNRRCEGSLMARDVEAAQPAWHDQTSVPREAGRKAGYNALSRPPTASRRRGAPGNGDSVG
jgi:hypothetical protein